MIPHILSDSSLTLVIGFTPIAVPKSHPNWEAILTALKDGSDEQTVRELTDIPAAIVRFTSGMIEVVDRQLLHNGQPVDTGLSRRIVDFISAGDETLAEPLCRFLERLLLNPSRRSVQGLYEWLAASNLPIMPDGRFIAWKIVRDDYMDAYSGTFSNVVGAKPMMARNAVDEDPDRTCSYGLHFCSTSYLPSYGPSDKRVMVVAVDPADVVAFPRDEGTAKGRASTYEVLAEVPRDEAAAYFDQVRVWAPSQPEPEDDHNCTNCDGDLDYENNCLNSSCPESPDYNEPKDDYITDVEFDDDGDIYVTTRDDVAYYLKPHLAAELAGCTVADLQSPTIDCGGNSIDIGGVELTLDRIIELDAL